MKTAPQLAREIGVQSRTITRWCDILGIAKTGRDYIIDKKQEALIRSNCYTSRGRPKSA